MAGPGKLPELSVAVDYVAVDYVAVDVEADGPILGPYGMLSLGMAVTGRPDLTFYTELRPISDQFVPEAVAVSGLDRHRLAATAPTAEEAMAAAAQAHQAGLCCVPAPGGAETQQNR